MSVPEALDKVLSETQQPVLFQLQDKYYVKVDSTAILVDSAACFYDVVEFLLWLFYVFDLSIEYELKPTFGFIEKVMKLLVSIGCSSAMSDLWHLVSVRSSYCRFVIFRATLPNYRC